MKNKLFWLAVIVLFSFLYGCHQKKNNDFFPVISFLNSQVKNVDTSLFSIMKVDKIDSVSDTTYVKREEFRGLAKDFLETPDITKYSIGKNYKEEKNYDENLNRVILIYTPIKENMEVIRQEVVIKPDLSGNDKVRSIIIEKMKDAKDGILHQRLLWQVDEKFQIVNIIEKNGEPVSAKTTEVIWNHPGQ